MLDVNEVHLIGSPPKKLIFHLDSSLTRWLRLRSPMTFHIHILFICWETNRCLAFKFSYLQSCWLIEIIREKKQHQRNWATDSWVALTLPACSS